MGIKIVSQPIGSPIIAAASTAMAQANQRTAERQSRMWMQQVEHKYNMKAAEAERTWETQQNDFNFGRQNALRPMTPGLKGNLRAASAWAKLQDEARNIYSGMTIDPRSPEAQERLKQIAEDMAMLESVNPDPTPEESFDKGRIFLDSSGSRLGPDGMPYKTPQEGGSELRLDPKTGKWGPPELDPAKEAERKAAEEANKKAEVDKLKAQEKANAENQKDYDERRDQAKRDLLREEKKILDDDTSYASDAERQQALDALRNDFADMWPRNAKPLPTPSAPPAGAAPVPGSPAAPAAPMPGAPVPSPVPASPGAPAPSGGGIVGPDGNPIVAPSEGTGSSSPMPWSPSPNVPGTPTDTPGKYVTEDGWTIYDNMQRYDQYGNPLDREGRPTKIVDNGDGNFITVPMTPEEAAKGTPVTVPRSAVTVPASPGAPAPVAPPAPVPGAAAPAAVPDTVTPQPAPTAQPGKAGPPKPPTATPMEEGEPLPFDMSKVPSAYWPTSDRKVILEPDEKNRVWKKVTDPKRVKELNMQVYTQAYDKLLPPGKTYEQLTPEEKVQVRQIKEGYLEVSKW